VDDNNQWAVFRRDNAFRRLTDQLANGATFGLNMQVKPVSDYLVAAGRRALGYDAPEPSDVYQKAREIELAKNAYGRNDEEEMEAQRAKEDDLRYAAILRALQSHATSEESPDFLGASASQRSGAPRANSLASPQYAAPFVTNALADRGQRNALLP
jgi:hypothetical protein